MASAGSTAGHRSLETVSNSMGWAPTCPRPKCCGARDGSQTRAILSPTGHSVMSGKVFSCHSWGVLLASSGERPGIAAMPYDAQEAPHLETIWYKMSLMPRLRNAGLNRKLQSTSVLLKTRHAQQSHRRPSPLLLCGVAPGTEITAGFWA